MWQLDNHTPFAAERGWVRDRQGAEIWLVAVKASFDVLPDGSLRVAQIQPPVLRLPEHHGEPCTSSIKYDTDLVLNKLNTDILVVGHAYAPQGTAVNRLDCGFKVGAVQKLLRVFGDRIWEGKAVSAARTFEKMPLLYERAYGGVDVHSAQPDRDWDWRNPVGVGFTSAEAPMRGLQLPNLEDPKCLIGHWKDRPTPAGLGAIASHWQPRVGFAGTYDDAWLKSRAPLLAEDMDERWYQSAPADQQARGYLQGGEPVVLHNLGPQGNAGPLEFFLPRVDLEFETHFHDGTCQPHPPAKLHTVILEPDFPRVSVVLHTALPCHSKVNKLSRTVVQLVADGCGVHSTPDLAVIA